VYLAYPLHERLGGSATEGVTKQAFLAWFLGKNIMASGQVGCIRAGAGGAACGGVVVLCGRSWLDVVAALVGMGPAPLLAPSSRLGLRRGCSYTRLHCAALQGPRPRPPA
jgi:hypothetical protein